MKKRFYSIKSIYLCLLWITLVLSPVLVKSQNTTATQSLSFGDLAERLWKNGEQQWRNSMIKTLATHAVSFEQFLDVNKSEYFKDRAAFFNAILENNMGENDAEQFFSKLKNKYVDLWNITGGPVVLSKQPGPPLPLPQAACNPSCYNISFQDGTLKGWSAYYAVNSSTTATANLTSKTGGLCGSVTQAGGPNPNTGNSYHVQLMPTTGNDVIAGGFVPYKPPMGGRSTMIGDGPSVSFGAGILEQTYMVDPSAPILTVQYAVLLENPGHTGFEQPWFRVEVLDQNGSAIPGCGQYFVVAAPNLPGFKSIPYGAGTVFCRPWTTAFVPLYNYIGQCITVRFTAADCGQGGHFGYAYVSATCEKLDLIPSSTGFCIGQQYATIKGPTGDPATTYQWSSTNGCISQPSNAQSVKVTCAGTYSLVMSSGGNCVDTFSMNLPAIPFGPPPVACFTSNKVCSGTPTTFNATCSNPNTNVKFYWDFYNSGNFDDSSGANPTWVYSSGGVYPVRLHVEDGNGCGSDTTINVIVDSTYTGTMPTVTITSTNVSACGQCNASISVTIKSPNQNSVLTNDFNTRRFTAGGSSTGTGWTTGGTSVSSVCINNVCSYTSKVTYSGVCAGLYNFFFNPVVSANPGPCNSGGVLYDTIPIFVGATGINITGNITSSASSCGLNNGTATVAGIGGTPGYTYSWVNPTNLGTGASKTGLSPGTYTVQVTDANGCLGIVKVVIGNFTALSAQVVPFDVSCYGANDGSINITPSAGIAPFTYSWSPVTGTNPYLSGLAAGTYSVLLTDNAGCTGTVTGVVKEPTKVIAVVNSCTCNVNCGQTGSAVVGASGGFGPYTYKWTNNTLTSSVTGLPAGTSTAVVTDAFGCKDSVSVTVTINNGPQVDAGPPKSMCIGGSVNLAGTSATGIGYSWSPAGSVTCSTCLNTSAQPTTTTLYNLYVVDATGCPSVDTVTVFVNSLPVVGASPSATLCIGASTQLTAFGGVDYVWSSNQTGTPISVTPPVGLNNYTVTITDVNGCINAATTSVTVNPLPVVIVSPPDTICLGASSTITASGGVGYSWSTGQSGIGLASITVPGASSGTTSYTVTVVDINGCINDSSTSVTVNPLASVLISPPVSLCPGSSTILTASGGVDYLWSTTETGSSITVTPPGTTTYSVDVTDVNGCKGSASVTVTINPLLAVTMSTPPPICIGSGTQISASPTGGTSYVYAWSPPDGLSSTTAQSPMASPTATTTYSVSVDDINGCHGDGVLSITVNPLPVITASNPIPICLGASSTITASGGVAYSWSTGQSGIGLASISVTPPVGTTNYTVIGIDANGCVSADTTSIIVNPLPVALITQPDSICEGVNSQLTASGGTTYVWSDGQSGQAITVTPVTGSNNYSVTVTDANGCTDTNSSTVFAEAPPAAFTSNADICVGQDAQLNASGGQNFNWLPPLYLNDPLISNPVATPPNTITYTVEVTNGLLCPPAYANALVTVSPMPVVTASADTAILAGMSAQLTSTGTGLIYNWTPPTGLSCTGCNNPLASPLQTTRYVITTIDQYGCQSFDTVLIKVEDILTLYVPTAFSPYNYDDSNNMFYAYGVGIWEFEFYVYDRWGALMFKTDDPTKGWDGSYNGQMVQQDVYVWLARAVSITGKMISKTGPVTVVH